MGSNKTKGKQRVTLELSPKSLDALGDVKRRNGTAQGATIDHLIDTFLDLDPFIAAQLHEFCQDQTAALGHSGVPHDAIQRTIDSRRESEWEKLSQHFSQVANAGTLTESELSSLGLTVVALADGRRELAPAGSLIINPDAGDLATSPYLSWYFIPEEPKGYLDAWRGCTVGGTFVYLSSRTDLHLFGKSQPLRFRSTEEQNACSQEARQLIGFMTGNARNVFSDYQDILSLQFAWALLSESRPSRQNIGVSFPIPRR